jgi:hypothetical protein
VDADLLDHYHRVQRHENGLAAARRLSWQAHRVEVNVVDPVARKGYRFKERPRS